VLRDVVVFKDLPTPSILIDLLSQVAESDRVVTEREHDLLQRIKAIVEA